LSIEDIRKLEDKTDWDRLRAEGDYVGEAEFEVDWARAELVIPETKRMISLRLDADVLDFFKAQGKGYQTRINAVLRAWMEAQGKR
jgi:uncharacterized protein (DUF4415 family)